MGRTAVAILSTRNLVHNARVLRQKAPRSRLIAMVKANAYGHGLRSVAQRLAPHVDLLGVASIDEALALRKVGIRTPILLAEGVFEATELLQAATAGFHVVFHQAQQLEWLEKLHGPVKVEAWLKVNTGMGRLGFTLEEAPGAYRRLRQSYQTAPQVRLMSHFACADEVDHPLNALQWERFQALSGECPGPRSLCNSAAVFNFPQCHYEFIRPGLALYGASPVQGQTAQQLGLRPVMTLQSTLISVQNMPAGAPLGYGARYVCPEAMPVGVVAIGYGDGYPRSTRDGAWVCVNRVRCPVVGRVSMDMLTVDLRGCPHARVGDPVLLWGEGLLVEELVPFTAHCAYDLLTGVQHRVKFLWTLEPQSEPVPDVELEFA